MGGLDWLAAFRNRGTIVLMSFATVLASFAFYHTFIRRQLALEGKRPKGSRSKSSGTINSSSKEPDHNVDPSSKTSTHNNIHFLPPLPPIPHGTTHHDTHPAFLSPTFNNPITAAAMALANSNTTSSATDLFTQTKSTHTHRKRSLIQDFFSKRATAPAGSHFDDDGDDDSESFFSQFLPSSSDTPAKPQPVTPRQFEDEIDLPPPKTPRDYILKEMLTSEITYVHSLHLLKSMYVDKLRLTIKEQTPRPIIAPSNKFHLTTRDLEEMFPHMDMLLKIHEEEILPILKDTVKRGDVVGIANLFAEKAKLFHTYVVYVTAIELQSEKRHQLCSSRLYASVIRDAMNDPRSRGRDLESLIIMPLQRVLKYSLLLRELQHHSSQDEQKYLQTAINEVKVVTNKVNERKGDIESRLNVPKVVEELRGIYGEVDSLMQPDRLLVDQFLCDVTRQESEESPAKLYAFNDLVLVACVPRIALPSATSSMSMSSSALLTSSDGFGHGGWIEVFAIAKRNTTLTYKEQATYCLLERTGPGGSSVTLRIRLRDLDVTRRMLSVLVDQGIELVPPSPILA